MTIKPDFGPLTDYLDMIQYDPVLIDAFRARYPELIRLVGDLFIRPSSGPDLGPLRRFDDIVALQFTTFDNGPKKRGSRWGGALKAFYDKPIDWSRPSWSANVRFIAHDRLDRELQKNKAIKQDTADALVQMASLGPDWLVGIASRSARGTGTHLFDEHVVAIRLEDDRVAECWIHRPDQDDDHRMLEMPPFVDRDARDEPLIGKAVAMSRWSEDDALSDSWATGSGGRA
jgi:hypothetical protein